MLRRNRRPALPVKADNNWLREHGRVVGFTASYRPDGATMTRWGRVLACHYEDKWKVEDIHDGRERVIDPATIHTIMPDSY